MFPRPRVGARLRRSRGGGHDRRAECAGIRSSWVSLVPGEGNRAKEWIMFGKDQRSRYVAARVKRDARGMSGPAARARGGGFTMVELLVAIAIVVVLAGLIIPSVQRAREHARLVVCASNLRQIDVAFRNRGEQEFSPRLPDASEWVTVVLGAAPATDHVLECPDGNPQDDLAGGDGSTLWFGIWTGNGQGLPMGSRLNGNSAWRGTKTPLDGLTPTRHYTMRWKWKPNTPATEDLVVEFNNIGGNTWRVLILQEGANRY